MKAYNPIAEGYQSEVAALDAFIEVCLNQHKIQDLVRLNIYLRRYLSPSVTRYVFRRQKLPLLLEQQQLDHIAALVLDMRGFVRTTRSGERSSEGLDSVARLLRLFFSRTIRLAFEHYGMVGEFAGDRVMVTFGFPPSSVIDQPGTAPLGELALNVRHAVSAAFAIQRMCEEIKADTQFPHHLRQFEVGIGICAGWPAWIGDIGNNHSAEHEDTWRQELTVISTAVNIAARAEEITKGDKRLHAAPDRKIIADATVIDQLCQFAAADSHFFEDLGKVDVRGLDEKVRLFRLFDLPQEAVLMPEPVTERDRMLVDWICEHIDGAIERDVFSKVHRSISVVGQAIAAGPTPKESTVLDQITEQVVISFKASKVTLYRVDSITKELVVMVSKGPMSLDPGTRFPRKAGLAGQVATSGKAFITDDVHTDIRWAGRRNSRFDPAIHAMMCAPLKAGGKTVGVIQVMDDRVGAFNQTDLDSLNVFAGLATVALENARTYEQAMHMARARAIITDAFSSPLTLREVLDAVMVAVSETLSVRNATLYLIDQETGELIFSKISSDSKDPPAPGMRLPAGTGIAGRVAASKTGLLIRDTKRAPDWYARIGSDIRSIVCVPLVAHGQVVGVIQALDRSPNFFSEEHLEILTWLSTSAAVTVNNAAQLEQARRKLVASEAVAGLGAISGKLAHNLKNYVGAIKPLANSLQRQLQTDDPKVAEKIERIIRSADHALAEVRSFMQPLTGWEPANIDLDTVLGELVEEVREALRARQQLLDPMVEIAIVYHPFSQRLMVVAGKDQVKYIFRNLIDNAIRAISEKDPPTSHGQISLTMSVERINEIDWAEIIVADTGSGIHPDNLDHIFEPSFTTRPEGTIGGYGLFWVRLNIERLGGRISATSRLGAGTVIHVRLPLVEIEAQG